MIEISRVIFYQFHWWSHVSVGYAWIIIITHTYTCREPKPHPYIHTCMCVDTSPSQTMGSAGRPKWTRQPVSTEHHPRTIRLTATSTVTSTLPSPLLSLVHKHQVSHHHSVCCYNVTDHICARLQITCVQIELLTDREN